MYSLFSKKQDPSPKNNQMAGKDGMEIEDEDSSDVVYFDFGGSKLKLGMKENLDPLLMQIIVNKDFLKQSLAEKQKQTKDSKLSKISNYYFGTALELFLRHHESKHITTSDESCSICMCEFVENITKLNIIDLTEDLQVKKGEEEIVRLEHCDGHYFHLGCLLRYIDSKASSHIKCPNCSKIYGVMIGDQPQGTMRVTVNKDMHCSGYHGCGTIVIEYHFPSGKLPNGKNYSGTSRVAYLPDNAEGREVLGLLRTSFDRKLTFTVGTSVTTGRTDTVVWNGVHHKTNLSGGSSHFGYPDATYFARVKEELAARGVF